MMNSTGLPTYSTPASNRIPRAIPAGFLLVIFLIGLAFQSPGQKVKGVDTVPDSVMEKKHNPVKAAVMSILLPGLGQVYNRKYWKVPVIYAGFGIMTYFIVTNTNYYLDYKSAAIEKSNGDTAGNYSNLVNKYSLDQLQSARDYYRRNLEISILLTTVWYILNIVDAAVDAHLFTYNISKDISLRWEPVWIKPAYSVPANTGLRLSLKF